MKPLSKEKQEAWKRFTKDNRHDVHHSKKRFKKTAEINHKVNLVNNLPIE